MSQVITIQLGHNTYEYTKQLWDSRDIRNEDFAKYYYGNEKNKKPLLTFVDNYYESSSQLPHPELQENIDALWDGKVDIIKTSRKTSQPSQENQFMPLYQQDFGHQEVDNVIDNIRKISENCDYLDCLDVFAEVYQSNNKFTANLMEELRDYFGNSQQIIVWLNESGCAYDTIDLESKMISNLPYCLSTLNNFVDAIIPLNSISNPTNDSTLDAMFLSNTINTILEFRHNYQVKTPHGFESRPLSSFEWIQHLRPNSELSLFGMNVFYEAVKADTSKQSQKTVDYLINKTKLPFSSIATLPSNDMSTWKNHYTTHHIDTMSDISLLRDMVPLFNEFSYKSIMYEEENEMLVQLYTNKSIGTKISSSILKPFQDLYTLKQNFQDKDIEMEEILSMKEKLTNLAETYSFYYE